MVPKFIDRSKLPHKPGVYQFKNISGKIIYVGKAIDLYHRVASYFSKLHSDLKTKILVENIKSVETIIVESEIEALILEANLIKKYKPQFNIRLIDDKDYLYIIVTKENFPKILTGRQQDIKIAKKYFGPFPSSKTVKNTLKILRRIFPWCSNPPKSTMQPRRLQVKYKPCFYYHLGLCPGSCVGVITKGDYQKIVDRFIKFLDGRKEQLMDELIMEMNKYAKGQNFEMAAKLKKTIEGIVYLTQSNRVKNYLENPNFLEDERQAALQQLQEALNLTKIPERIEGYDISNIQGTNATSSMVVLTDGEVDKSQYRKFKIRVSGKPDDYAMHMETIKRRMNHPEWGIPDMLLIDGGKGQVSSVYKAIQLSENESFKRIPLFGIAKRMEWLYAPDGREIRLSKSHPGLQLLQRLRDEAHRFAITYHRKLRGNIKI